MRFASRWLRRLTTPTRRQVTNPRLRSPRMNMLCLEDRVTPSAPAAPPGYTATTTSFTNSTVTALPDDPVVIVTLNVSGIGTYIHDVDLITNMLHTYPADQDITLKSPAGTIVTITTDNAGTNDNAFNGTRWDDQADPGNPAPYTADILAASNLVTDASYTLNSPKATLVPEEPLAAFIGEDPNGTWTLTIDDDAGVDIGTLNSWTLDITTLNASPTVIGPTPFTNAVATAIPDATTSQSAPGTVSLTLNVSGVAPYLDRLTLFTDIVHANNGHLDMTLTSPGGLSVTISTDNSAVANVFNGTTWSDKADPGNESPYASPNVNSNVVGDASYTANTTKPTLTPEEALGSLRGIDPNGTWTLVVSDDTTGSVGTVNSWSLNIFTVGAGTPAPIASGTGTKVLLPDGTTHKVTVVYTDLSGSELVDYSSIGIGDIRIKTPDVSPTYLLPTSAVATPMADAKSISVVYSFPARGGSWNADDNGVYDIEVIGMQVYDKDMPAQSVAAGKVGSFTVAVAANTIYGNTYGDNDLSGTLTPGDTAIGGVVVYDDQNNNGMLDAIPHFNGTTGVAPDYSGAPTTTDFTANVAGLTGTMTHLTVSLDITMTYDGDLDILIIAPDSTSVQLVNRIGGLNDNFTGTVFDDNAAAAINTGTAPYTGTWLPQLGMLSSLYSNLNGTWTLRIVDNAAGDTATLNSWSLDVTTTTTSPGNEPSVTSAVNGDYVFSGLANGLHHIRRVLPSGLLGNGDPVGGVYDITLTGNSTTNRNFGHKLDPAPVATGSGAAIKTAGGMNQTISVTYSDNVGSQLIDYSTISKFNVRVIAPDMGMTILSPTSATPNPDPMGNAKSITVDYVIPALGGVWDSADNGTYKIEVVGNQVYDKDAPANATPAGVVGSFTVGIAKSYLVDKLGDDDDGNYGANETTFREALKQANDISGTQDTITFKGSVFTAGTMISLVGSGYKISDSVSIVGPGVDNLTFQGLGSYRVFEVNNGAASVIDVSISNLKVEGGAVIDNNGAGFLVNGENLSLTDVEVNFNSVVASGSNKNGGGISLTGASTLNLERVRMIGNSAAGNGGAIDGGAGGATITINNSTIASNIAGNNVAPTNHTGGGISNGDVVLTITNSTISGNTANGTTSVGGGISTVAGSISIENSTISNNTANQGGGIGLQSFAKTLSLRYSTMNGNYAVNGVGGGISRVSGAGVIDIYSSVVSGNTGVSADIFSGGTVNVNYSAIGVNTGFTLTGSKNLGFGANVKLGFLTNNGGLTETQLPDQGSPLFNAGPSSTTVSFDQRGQSRLQQSRVDIGAVESLNLLPNALMNPLGPITVAAATPDVVTIVYSDNGTITASSIKAANIQVVGMNSFVTLPILSATLSPNMNAPSISVDYKLDLSMLPGGGWSKASNDTYIVRLLAANSVVDNDMNPVATADTDIGSFVVAIPANYVVNVVSDTDDFDSMNGMTTLREAIREANSDGVPSAISFNAGTFATPQLIMVGSSYSITEPVSISAPATLLTLQSLGGDFRGFDINLTTPGGVVSMSRLAVMGFSVTGNGGGISSNADLSLSEMVIGSNTASVNGGGIALATTSAKLTMTRSVVHSNITTTNDGAGIYLGAATTVNIDQSVVRDNIADSTGGDGAGIFAAAASTITIQNSTISGNIAKHNSAAFGGGGIYVNDASVLTINNSTISGNQTAGGGGGIHIDDATGILNLNNSTVVGNAAGVGFTGSGGGINIRVAGGKANIVSSIIAGNTAVTSGPDIFGAATIEASNVGNDGGSTLTQVGTNLVNVDPLVGALSDNDGFVLPDGSKIMTHAITISSPVVDQGRNKLGLTTDQRGAGFGRTANNPAVNLYDGTDIGAFELPSAATPPTVSAVLTNGVVGGQRSRVTSIVVNFSEVVTIANPSAAFQINRYANGGADVPPTGLVGYTVAGLNGMNQGSSVTITFNGSGAVGVDPGNSLRDGKYEVIVVASQVAGAGGFLDGNANGKYDTMDPLMDNNRTTTWRLFGDGNGDGAVTASDFNDFRLYYGSTGNPAAAPYDFDNSNSITAADFNAFRTRYGNSGFNMP